ncbi:HAUS augmin-like complex subunit 5 [Dermochelys coriacea]|uniref:HAUS augmin-like complex subunit 5 n=1 Tax=Dermochelys coriacea TaxID=27794 RepID=UPI0018E77FD1|nr:HAUS augmin-like complex subunit 5 [Dermochelys coriacea]
MAELKKELLALHAQLGYKSQALAHLQQHQDSPGTNEQALVQDLWHHDQEQARALGPRIQLVTEQCGRHIERWPKVQAAIDAWWEQPGQFSLPAEHRQGLTLQQWLERWTLALKTLQQHSTPAPKGVHKGVEVATPRLGKECGWDTPIWGGVIGGLA